MSISTVGQFVLHPLKATFKGFRGLCPVPRLQAAYTKGESCCDQWEFLSDHP